MSGWDYDRSDFVGEARGQIRELSRAIAIGDTETAAYVLDVLVREELVDGAAVAQGRADAIAQQRRSANA